METVMPEDMNTLEDEDKIEREQDQLAQNMFAYRKSLGVNSVKEILLFSHKYFDTLELLTFFV